MKVGYWQFRLIPIKKYVIVFSTGSFVKPSLGRLKDWSPKSPGNQMSNVESTDEGGEKRMPQSELRLIKRCEEFVPKRQNQIPAQRLTRHLRTLQAQQEA
jgi:hypothetical protein